MNSSCSVFAYLSIPAALRSLIVVFLLLAAGSAAQAGRYGTQQFTYPTGTVPGVGNWTEEVTLSSFTPGVSNVPIATVVSNALRLTAEGYFGTVTAFKLPDLDPGQDIAAFTASFTLKMAAAGKAGRGISLSFGTLADYDGDGELGFSVPGGLIIGFDTFVDASSGETQGEIAIFSDRVKIASYPQNFTVITTNRTVSIKLDAQGLDLSYGGVVIADNLQLPGFAPRIGDRFAFSARTGDTVSQETFIDAVQVVTTPSGSIPTGGPIISEFVASNKGGLEDDDLSNSDWIEIYNGGASTNLAGWFLTNEKTNLTKWLMPAVSVKTNSYILVFASGRDRTATNGQLHANFTLQAGGGYLALVRPDLSVATEYVYGPQGEDVAFGEIGQARVRGYLETPTPGKKNISLLGEGLPLEDVQFSREGGIITGDGPVSLEIYPPATPGAQVRYTLNNTVPTGSSLLYQGPISISSNTTVRARTFLAGRLPGPVRSRSFLKIDASLSSYAGTGKPFSSPIPILVMDSFGVDVDGGDRTFRLNYTVAIDRDPQTGRATITDAPDFQGRSGIHVRGESSGGFGQKSYALEMWDEFNADRDDSILGLPAESDWVLHGPWSEKTLMRNHLVYQTMQEIRSDYSGSRTRFVEVFLNAERNQPVSYADYKGVYLLVEKIKSSKNRLDIGKINSLVTDSNLITGGYVFKKDKASTGTTGWTTAKNGIELQSQDPESLTPSQLSYLRGYINSFETALASPQFGDPLTGYAAYIDVGSFVDAQLYTEIAKQVDGYVFSTYFNKPRGGKIKAGPTWDFNIALGNADYGTGDTPRGWLYAGSDLEPLAGGLWYAQLQKDPEYRLKFYDRYWELRRGVWGTSNMMARIDSLADMLQDGNPAPISNTTPPAIQSPAARQYRKHQILGIYQWPNPAGVEKRTTFQSEITYMKQWILDRLNWMDDQALSGSTIFRPPTLGQLGGSVPLGFTLSMAPYSGTAPSGRSYAAGSVFYTTDGSDPRPSGYGVPTNQDLPLVPEYSGVTYFVPTEDNGGSAALLSDWTGVSLGGTASGLAWSPGTMGLGFDDTNSPIYKHIGGGNVALGDIRSQMQGKSSAVFMRVPFTLTDVQLQRMVDLRMKIRFDDGFIAFLNGFEVGRVHVKSNTPAAYNTVADAIAAGWRDTTAALGRELNLSASLGRLRAGQNMLAILGVNSNRVDDDALFSAQLNGVLSIPPTTQITASNYVAPVPITGTTTVKARTFANGVWSPLVAATFVVDAVPAAPGDLVISEFMYHAKDPNAAESVVSKSAGDYEFIEFLNTGASAIDLSGVRITNGVRFAFNDGDPSALRLPVGQRVLVVANKAAFQKRYGTNASVRIAGTYADNLSNSGEQITVVAANGAKLFDFTYGDSAPWPSEADGSGYSLVFDSPFARPMNDPALAKNWHTSLGKLGTPGFDDSQQSNLPPFGDEDGDGLLNLYEFATGSDPRDPSSRGGLSASIGLFTIGGRISRYYSIEFRRNLGAGNLAYDLEASTDLVHWSTQSGLLVFAGSRNNGDGTSTVSYRSAQPVEEIGAGGIFARLVIR